MAFLPPSQFNFSLPSSAPRNFFNFQNKKDNLFDKQLITTFALNDLTHTKILNDMYSKDILMFADLLNNTPVQNWNIEIKNALIKVNSNYWKTIF